MSSVCGSVSYERLMRSEPGPSWGQGLGVEVCGCAAVLYVGPLVPWEVMGPYFRGARSLS